jgi:hypothetical protein
MTYNETLARLMLLRDELTQDCCSNRVATTNEFMKLKRSLSKFPEHKAKKVKNVDSI